MASPLGFIGLGNMGGPMAGHIAEGGAHLIVFDAAGTEARAPAGTQAAGSAAEVAERAGMVLLSLPDGGAVERVSDALLAAPKRRVELVVDTSTIGVASARRVDEKLREAGIEFVDAPVSGGVAGAKAGSISVMCACAQATLERIRPVLEMMAKHVFHVGRQAGQGQAMKVLNNFLSATAMAATSEALAFGEQHGLDMRLMLDVLNVSTGKNTASADKFPNRVLTQSFDAGFTSTQMNKDLALYRESLAEDGGAGAISAAVTDTWQRFERVEPGADITRIYPFVRSRN